MKTRDVTHGYHPLRSEESASTAQQTPAQIAEAAKVRRIASENAQNRYRNPSRIEAVKNFPHTYAPPAFSWGENGETQRTAVAEMIREIDKTGLNMRVHNGVRLGFGVGKNGYQRAFLLQERFKLTRQFYRTLDRTGTDAVVEEVANHQLQTAIPNPVPGSFPLFGLMKAIVLIPTGWYVLKDLVFRKLGDVLNLFSVGVGPNRKRLQELMEQEADDLPSKEEGKKSAWERFKGRVSDYEMGRSTYNRNLHVKSKPKDLFASLTQVMRQEGKKPRPMQRLKEDKIVCPEEFLEGDDTSTLVTFATRIKHEHTIRRAEKETGPWGAWAHYLCFWRSVEDYGIRKAKSCREKDKETINNYDLFMQAAKERLGIKDFSIPEPFDNTAVVSSSAMQKARIAYDKERGRLEELLLKVKNVREKEELFREIMRSQEKLKELHGNVKGPKDAVAKAMVQVYSWMRGALTENSYLVNTSSVEELEKLRQSVHERLKILAVDDEAEWEASLGVMSKRSASHADINAVSMKLGKRFTERPEVKELRSLLEMTEGALALAMTKVTLTGLSTEEKLEACINYGQMIYSDLDKHFHIWAFNKHISPNLKHLDHFSQHISTFGIYRFGPTMPNKEVLERFPLLKVCVEEEYNHSMVKKPIPYSRNVGTTTEDAVLVGSYLAHNRGCKDRFEKFYRFVSCVEGDAGHKSFILDPVDEGGNPVTDHGRRGLYIAEGTRFDKEWYEYRERPNRSGIRHDYDLNCAESVAEEKIVDRKGNKVPAHQAVADLMEESPYKYVCMGHSLGAVTVQGVVSSKEFPVEKIARVAAFAGPGIRNSANVRFYEKAQKVLETEALPLTIIEAVLGKGKGTKEMCAELLRSTAKIGPFFNKYGGIEKEGVLNAALSQLRRGDFLTARQLLEEKGFVVTDKIPTCLNLTAKWDIVGHLGSAPYQLGLLNDDEIEKYKAVHWGTATVISHIYTLKKGFFPVDWHNDLVFDNAMKDLKPTEIVLEMVDKNTLTRKVVKRAYRAWWYLNEPWRFLTRLFFKYVTERYKNIYGYGTERAKYGQERLRNICTKIDTHSLL